jgi:chromosome partitioning protein
MILLLGGEKGGTGKTTIATNLAALRAAAGMMCYSSTPTGRHCGSVVSGRAEDPPARIACVQLFGKNVQTGLRDLAGRYREVIIDAGAVTLSSCGVRWLGQIVLYSDSTIPI